jgi:hypothetical protein
VITRQPQGRPPHRPTVDGMEEVRVRVPWRPEHNLADDITWMAVDLAGSLDEPTQPSPNQATRPRLAQRVGSSPVRTVSRTGRSCCRPLPPRVAHR